MDDVRLIEFQRQWADCTSDDVETLNLAAKKLDEMHVPEIAHAILISKLRIMAEHRKNSRHLMTQAADRLEDLAERVAIMEEGGVSSDMSNAIVEGIDTIFGLLYMAKTVYRSSGKAKPELDSLLQTLCGQVEDCTQQMARIITDPEDAVLLCITRRLKVQELCGG